MWKTIFICLALWPCTLFGAVWNTTDFAGTNILNKTNTSGVATALGLVTNGAPINATTVYGTLSNNITGNAATATHLSSGDTQTNTTIMGATVTGNVNPTNAVLTNNISGNSSTASAVNPTNFNSQFTALGGVTNRQSADLVVTNAGVSTTVRSNSVTTGTFIGSAGGLTNVGTSGRAQLVDGTNRISTTAIQLNSIVLLTYFSIDGTSASPFYRTNDIAAGSAFTVRSGVTGDTNSINWFIVP